MTLRLRSNADLSGARRELADGFAKAGLSDQDSDDAVLAVCELLTNALAAADVDTTVTAVASVSDDQARDGVRRIEVEIINTGEPLPGRLVVDGSAGVAPGRIRGRGLVLAAKMGDVTVEGLIGGTRARFRRVVDDSSHQSPAAAADGESESADPA
ncbi:MAG: ATP-binding protein [Ilumatobacteraceae bacterium]